MTSVPEFYAGKHVFITGATGFIGKVLIEKLLRSCPDIAGIHCLIRSTPSSNAADRLKELCTARLFDVLRESSPNFTDKIYAIRGNLIADKLGICESDEAFLEKNISIIFHSAAITKFNQPLRKVVAANLLPVRKLLQLAKRMCKLECLVHVSTAFAHCDRKHVEEQVYTSPIEPQKLIDLVHSEDGKLTAEQTKKLLGPKPNTYTYSKHIAEALLVSEGEGLPLVIVRPSNVLGAWREPVPGWTDHLIGLNGFALAVRIPNLILNIEESMRV